MSLTGCLSQEEDEVLAICAYICGYMKLFVHVHSRSSLILSLSRPNGAASGTAVYYLCGPVNSKPITHFVLYRHKYMCVCVWSGESACERQVEWLVSGCLTLFNWAIVCHNCHELPQVRITRKIDTCYTLLTNFQYMLSYFPPSCQHGGIDFWKPLTDAPHVHSKSNETLHSFPCLSPQLAS